MKYKKISNGFFLRFISGENVLKELTDFLEKEKIFSGTIKGIGALQEAELGFFSSEKNGYETKSFEGDLEVISFLGNISLKEGKPFFHVHVSLGKKDFSVIGGHFVSGTVGATLEVFIKPFEQKIERTKQPSGLFLLDLESEL